MIETTQLLAARSEIATVQPCGCRLQTAVQAIE
jgi:hypothetical protein